MAVTIHTTRWEKIGTLLFDVSVDNNASVFYPAGTTIAVGNERLLTADALTRFDALLIVSKDAALTGTVSVQVLGDPSDDQTNDASWHILQSGGSDVTVVANKATVIAVALAAAAVRLTSSGAEAADRTFIIYGRRPATV